MNNSFFIKYSLIGRDKDTSFSTTLDVSYDDAISSEDKMKTILGEVKEKHNSKVSNEIKYIVSQDDIVIICLTKL